MVQNADRRRLCGVCGLLALRKEQQQALDDERQSTKATRTYQLPVLRCLFQPFLSEQSAELMLFDPVTHLSASFVQAQSANARRPVEPQEKKGTQTISGVLLQRLRG
jgi:hypothetical protein